MVEDMTKCRKMKNILYVITTQQKDGPGNVLISILNNLDRTQFNPIVVYMYYKTDAEEDIFDFINEKVTFINLNMSSPFKGWLDFRAILKLKEIIEKYNIDIIHMHLHRPIIFGILAAKNKKILKIATIHNQEPHQQPKCFFEFLVNKLEYWALMKCDYITTVSKAVKNSILTCYKNLSNKNVEVIYNCVELLESKGRPNIRRKFNISKDEVIVASIARLEVQKGITYLIDAIKILNSQGIKNFKVLIIGEGNLEKELKNKVKDIYLEDTIIFTGYMKDIQSVLKEIDIVVMTSIFEGLGLSLIEAMANKVSCIGTNVGGIPEVLGDNEFIVEKANPLELASKLKELIEDKNKRRFAEKKLYNRYVQVFMPTNMIERYKMIYSREMKK